MATNAPQTTESIDDAIIAGMDPTPSNETTSDLNHLRNRARQGVMEAVAHLPTEESQAYLEALDKAPVICKLESDPLIFLRRCDYDAKAAAERICLYWKERKDLFGVRALLPMTQTGNGALTRQDALQLHAGWPAFLPRTTSGLQVVLFDRRQYHPLCTTENRLRCVFYCTHIVAQDERAQVEGVHIIVIVTTKTGVDPDFDEFMKRSVFIAKRALPIKPLVELLVQSPPGIKRYTIQDTLAVMVGYYIQFGSTQDNLGVTPKREDGEMLDRLHQLGLRTEGIPKCMGGTWTYTKFTAWCREQATKELETECNIMISMEPHVIKEIRSSLPTHELKDSATKQRERNIIHSRRKRERRNQEVDEMRVERARLEQERLALVADQNHLEDLMRQAEQVLGAFLNHG